MMSPTNISNLDYTCCRRRHHHHHRCHRRHHRHCKLVQKIWQVAGAELRLPVVLPRPTSTTNQLPGKLMKVATAIQLSVKTEDVLIGICVPVLNWHQEAGNVTIVTCKQGIKVGI